MQKPKTQNLDFQALKKFFSETEGRYIVFDNVITALELLNTDPMIIKEYLAVRFMDEKKL